MQRNLAIGLILTIATVAIIGVIWANEPSRLAADTVKEEARSIERGALLFGDYCAGCHGLRGEGVPGLTPPLNVEDLWTGRADIQFYGTLHDYMVLTTEAGHTRFGMPAWADDYGGPLRDDQVGDVVRFMINWQGPQPADVRPEAIVAQEEGPAAEGPAPLQEGDPVNGRAVSDNWCAACHGPTGEGTNLGPPINRAGVLAKSDDFLRTITEEGIPGTSMIDFKSRLAPQEIADVIAFMRTWEPEEPPAPGEGDPAMGATLYLGNCAPCHGINGEGAPLGSALNLTDVMAKDDDFLRTITLEGIPGTAMIDFEARMSGQDVDDIVAFMRTWTPKERPLPGQDLASGARVYASSCASCHGADGEGTAIGPALNDPGVLAKGDDFLREMTREGIPGTSMLAFKARLTDREMEDLVAFMLSWAGGSGLVGDVAKGAEVYATFCASCHGVDGEGTAIGPALSDPSVLAKGDDYVRELTRDGIPGGSMVPFKDRLTAQEIEDAVAFILNWASATSSEAPAPVPKPTLLPSPTATQELVQPTPTPAPGVPTSLPEPTPGAVSALGDAESGATIYAESCAMCHGDSGEGALVEEPLNDEEYLSTHDDDEIFEEIAEGSDGAMPAFAQAQGGSLSEAEIWDVVALIRSWQN